MRIPLTKSGKSTLVHLLPTCGGTLNRTMLTATELLRDSNASDFYEALGPFGRALLEGDTKSPGTQLEPLEEIVETALETTGAIDLESVIMHFSGDKHTHKFDKVPTVVAAELPVELRAFAHTLIPLTLVGGSYYYDNGEAHVQLRGLVQFGPSKGTPYAHLAGLVWLEDGGISAKVLSSQLQHGLPSLVSSVSLIDYDEAPRLQASTRSAKEALGL